MDRRDPRRGSSAPGHLAAACGLTLLSAWLASTDSRAEPAIAARTGYRCSQCHVNRTGGGLRTSFGSLYSQLTQPARLLEWRGDGSLLPADPDARLQLGGNFRLQYLNVESDDVDDTSSFEVPEANAYLQVRLVPGRFSLYVDETLGPGGASSRELFGLFEFSGGRSYLKAGKLLPPYGWRLPDDDAFVRRFTGFGYTAPDNGVELGFEPGRWSLHLAAINGSGGSDADTSTQFTLLGVRRFRAWRAGLSASNNITDAGTITHAGLLVGGNAGRLAWIAEGDWVEVSAAATSHRLVGLLEADVLAARGVNLKLAHDWLDPDTGLRTNAQARDSLGVELIPFPFLQLRWFVRYHDGPRQTSGANDTQVDFEAHFFF